jgi:pimeloyl-ACP methyl ester carboxylesterase
MNHKKIQRYRQAEEKLLERYKLQREEHTIDVEKFRIKVRVQSIGKGPKLLFIHGGPNAGSTWMELASMLRGYQCLLLDRPGCGLSDAVDYTDMTRDKITELIVHVLESVLNHFKIDRVSVVASSFGAYFAIKYAIQKPDRIENLILEGCPALIEESGVPPFMKSMSNPIMKWLIPKLPSTSSYSKKIMKEIGHTHSIDNEIIPEFFIEWYVDLCKYTDTLKNDISAISKATKGGKLNPEFVLYDSEIGKLNPPTLWLWGKDDTFGGMEIGNRLNSLVKNSTILYYDNSGHLPWLDIPKDHAEEISKFLST